MATKIKKYQKEYVIRSYETDCHGFLRIGALMNILQDIAVENAERIGFGFEECRKLNTAWVGANYLLHISRLPHIEERIVIETWPAETKLCGAVRDFVVRDADKNIILTAMSLWILIDIERRRPLPLSKFFPQYSFIPERAIDADFAKINEVPVTNNAKEFAVRFDDIDINHHVNNSVYPLWASESVDADFRKMHVPCELEINFKKEALYGETVRVDTLMENENSYHTIRDKDSESILALCRIKWKTITSK